MNPKQVIAEELCPFSKGQLTHANPTDVPLADVVLSYAVANHMEKVMLARKKELKPHLMAQAEAHGEITDKGGNIFVVGQDRIIREKRVSSEPDQEKLRALMQTHGIPLEGAFDEVKVLQVNASKLQFLVDTGKLDKAEVAALHEETYALKVQPGSDLKELILEACGAVDESEEEKPRRKGRARK